jgi:hypothetical protein
MPDISKYSKGMGFDKFKTQYLSDLSKEGGSFNNKTFENDWSAYKITEPKTTNSSGGSNTSGGGNALKTYSQVQDFNPNMSMGNATDLTQFSDGVSAIQETISNFFGKEGGFVNGVSGMVSSALGKVNREIPDILSKEVKLRGDLNATLGVAGELADNYRETISQSLTGVVAMGYGWDDMKGMMIGLMEQTGRFTTLNEKTVRDTAVTSRAFVGDLSKMAEVFTTYEKVGIGAESALDAINQAGTKSISLGLNGKKTVEEINKNIGKLNEYGFKNGIEGLTRMVQKATEFRMSMDSVLGISDKVMDPEQAISLSANLQVLGGAIGDFNDPLKMMYDATNNVEGLQDALIGAAGSLATYNTEQGRFEITGVNLRRAKAMAAELGISYTELANGAIASAERTSAATELMANGLKLDDKQTEFITNLARMKDGKMSIDVSSISKEFGGAQSIALDKLTDTQVEILQKNQDALKEMSPEKIAREQFTATQNMMLNISEITALLKTQFSKSVRPYTKKADAEINKLNQYASEGLKGGNNALGREINRAKSKVDEMANEGKVKSQESLKIDNKPKQKPTEEKTNGNNFTKEDLKEVMMDVHTSTKNDKNKPITINNNLEPTNPSDYLYIKI